MGAFIWGHLEGLHPQGVVFQAFSTIRLSSPCHWLSNAPPFFGGQLERVGSHHGFWVWPPFKFAPRPCRKKQPKCRAPNAPPAAIGQHQGVIGHTDVAGHLMGTQLMWGSCVATRKPPQSGQFPPQKHLEHFCAVGHRNFWSTSGNHCLPLGL